MLDPSAMAAVTAATIVVFVSDMRTLPFFKSLRQLSRRRVSRPVHKQCHARLKAIATDAEQFETTCEDGVPPRCDVP
jgi:hypothetical protein